MPRDSVAPSPPASPAQLCGAVRSRRPRPLAPLALVPRHCAPRFPRAVSRRPCAVPVPLTVRRDSVAPPPSLFAPRAVPVFRLAPSPRAGSPHCAARFGRAAPVSRRVASPRAGSPHCAARFGRAVPVSFRDPRPAPFPAAPARCRFPSLCGAIRSRRFRPVAPLAPPPSLVPPPLRGAGSPHCAARFGRAAPVSFRASRRPRLSLTPSSPRRLSRRLSAGILCRSAPGSCSAPRRGTAHTAPPSPG